MPGGGETERDHSLDGGGYGGHSLSGDGGSRSSGPTGSSRGSGAGNNSASSGNAGGGTHASEHERDSSLGGGGGAASGARSGGSSQGQDRGSGGRATSNSQATGARSGGTSGVNSARGDTPSSARSVGSSLGGSTPTGFGGPLGDIGRRATSTINASTNTPTGIDPNIDPTRFGRAPTSTINRERFAPGVTAPGATAAGLLDMVGKTPPGTFDPTGKALNPNVNSRALSIALGELERTSPRGSRMATLEPGARPEPATGMSFPATSPALAATTATPTGVAPTPTPFATTRTRMQSVTRPTTDPVTTAPADYDMANRTRMQSVTRPGQTAPTARATGPDVDAPTTGMGTATGFNPAATAETIGLATNNPAVTPNFSTAPAPSPATGAASISAPANVYSSPTGTYAEPTAPAASTTADTAAPAAPQGPIGLGTAAGLVNEPVSQVGQTPAMTEQPTYGVDLATAPKAQFTMVAGKPMPTTDVPQRVAAAWASVLGEENVKITGLSGLRTSKKGARSGRHGPTVGSALDYSVSVRTPTGWRELNFGNKADYDLANEVAVVGARDFGLKGYGVGNGYMHNTAIHHDVVANPKTGAYEWTGPNARSAGVPQSVKSALAEARASYKEGSFPAPPSTPTPVASIMSTDQPDAAQVALNNYGKPQTTETASTTDTSTVPTVPTAPSTPAPTSVTDTLSQNAFPTDTVNPTVSLPNRAPTPKPPGWEYKRSPTGWAKATGIDIITSTIGGPVGLAANLFTGLVFGDTVGGVVADASEGKYGMNYYQPGDPYDPKTGYGGMRERGAGGYRSSTESGDSVNRPITTSSTVPTPADDFIEKYLEFDDTKRPTPREKFWTDRATYGAREYG